MSNKMQKYLNTRNFYNKVMADVANVMFVETDKMVLYGRLNIRKKRELERIMKA